MANLVWQPLALVHRFAFGFPISTMTLMVYDRLMVEAHRHHKELMEGKTMCRLDHNEVLQNYAISMIAMPKNWSMFTRSSEKCWILITSVVNYISKNTTWLDYAFLFATCIGAKWNHCFVCVCVCCFMSFVWACVQYCCCYLFLFSLLFVTISQTFTG